MNQVRSQAIVLSRTDYGEADRILTLLTPNHGKVRAIAKAVRKSTSKLAGGIELFSVSDICFVGRGEIKTITSTRLIIHYGNIVKNIDRTNLAYELLKLLDKVTEEHTEPAYFNCLKAALTALDDSAIDSSLVRLWFDMQLLRLAGHTPNLREDVAGNKLAINQSYDFDASEMAFVRPVSRAGSFGADHIKLLRLGFSAGQPGLLARVANVSELAPPLAPLVRSMLGSFVRI